jgi:hypothetical protein
VTSTEDAGLRQRVHGLLEMVAPPVAPVDAIIRRGRGVRLRRAGAAVGGLGLAAIIAALVLTPAAAPRPPAPPAPLPATETAGLGGVFARGVADGRTWRLAVQDIADPGYPCIPAITVNGTDADPVSPDPGNGADVTLGAAAPGIGFAFIQLPAFVQRIVLDGQENLPATTATACGLTYRVVGFAYRLSHQPRITSVITRPGWPKLRDTTGSGAANWPAVYTLPLISDQPSPSGAPQTDGMWNSVSSTGAEPTRSVLASGADGWSIALIFGPGGDCYDFSAPGSPGSPEMSTCGPISTPDGPETIVALPLAYPPGADNGTTGYAVQVSPATAHLRATASDGSTQLVTPHVVDGRRYAAFVVGRSLRLKRLTWLNAAGQEIASTTALPEFGYTQFQP